MMQEFKMKDLGLMFYFLDLDIKQSKYGIFVSQEAYGKEILKLFRMENCHPIGTPVEVGIKLYLFYEGKEIDVSMYRSLVGCLSYLTGTMMDIHRHGDSIHGKTKINTRKP